MDTIGVSAGNDSVFDHHNQFRELVNGRVCMQSTESNSLHRGQMPTEFASDFSTPVANDKGRSHQQSQVPF
jgi:hypothetical protein